MHSAEIGSQTFVKKKKKKNMLFSVVMAPKRHRSKRNDNNTERHQRVKHESCVILSLYTHTHTHTHAHTQYASLFQRTILPQDMTLNLNEHHTKFVSTLQTKAMMLHR